MIRNILRKWYTAQAIKSKKLCKETGDYGLYRNYDEVCDGIDRFYGEKFKDACEKWYTIKLCTALIVEIIMLINIFVN